MDRGVPMLLPQTAEYALRAMAHLATLAPGSSTRAAEISEATGIPAQYVWKIMRRLVLADLVSSQKGHGGGFALRRDPKSISFREILQAVGFATEVNRCAFGWGRCSSSRPCPLHGTWSQLKDAFEQWSQRTTLAQIPRGFVPIVRVQRSRRRL